MIFFLFFLFDRQILKGIVCGEYSRWDFSPILSTREIILKII